MNATRLLLIAGVLGAIGVSLGAFGAHGLAQRVTPDDLAIWRTAAHYQQIHAVALLAIALASQGNAARSGWLSWAATSFVVGVVVFSGSLYTLVLTDMRWLGAVTPLGGLALIVAWVLVGCHALAASSGRPSRPAVTENHDRKR